MEKDFTTSILVDQSPEQVYSAINNVRGWWHGEITGITDQPDVSFTYQMKTFHRSTQKITELVPSKKISWQVTDSDLSFVSHRNEWTGTTIHFDIEPEGNKTRLVFIHRGLNPSFECYGGCSNGWTKLIQESLYNLITTGKGVEVF